MRSLLSSRRSSVVQRGLSVPAEVGEGASDNGLAAGDLTVDLPLPPTKPEQQPRTKNIPKELDNMEEFADKLEATCRLVTFQDTYYFPCLILYRKDLMHENYLICFSLFPPLSL